MVKSCSYLLVAALLTACGGGGGGASPGAPAASAPPPAASQPPAGQSPAPAGTPATTLSTPPAASGPSLSAGRMNTDVSANSYQVNFNGVTDLTVGGNLNNFWVGAAQPGGTVTVGGASNTFVFKASATPAT